MRVCAASPCLSLVRDSVGGRALPCPRLYSEVSWRPGHVRSCACMSGWMHDVYSEVGTDGPDFRTGGVVCVACEVVGVILRSVLFV